MKQCIHIVIVGALVFAASCSANVDFSGDSKNDDGKKDGNSEKNSGDETADDPTMVGGAYLACAFVNDKAPAGTRYIGCAINDAQTGDKRSLNNYQMDWSISQGGQPVTVDSVDGTDAAPYHKKYTYRDDAFIRQNLTVQITAKSGQSYSYHKGLNKLDASLRDAPGKTGTLSLASLGYIGVVQSNSGTGTITCDANDPFCSGIQIAQIVAQSKGYCDNGRFNKDTLLLLGLKAAEYQSPQAFTFGSEAVCVVNDKQNNVAPTIQGGCYIIPVRSTLNQISMRIVSQKSAPLNSVQMETAIAPHICAAN